MQSDPVIVEYKIAQLQLYQKIDIPRHIIKTLAIAPMGSKILLETLEGPVEITANPDTYVMIGPYSDVYPITRQYFQAQYTCEEEADPKMVAFVQAHGWDASTLKQCRLKQASYIYATPVPFAFRVFLKELNAFITGSPGDYYAVPANAESGHNPYIIRADIMAQTYKMVFPQNTP